MVNHRIIAISGPVRGWVFPITDEEFTVGRDEANRVCLQDDLVSRRHFSVRIEDGSVVLRDLESANGTIVNGEEIPAGGKRVLAHLDRLRVGSSTLVYYEHEGGFGKEDTRARSIIRLSAASGEPGSSRSDKVVLSALLRVSSEMNRIRKSDDLQNRLLELILEVMPAERVAILLTGQKNDNFVSRTYRDIENSDPVPFPISSKVTHETMRHGESVLSNDVDSVVCAPLAVFGTKLGVIYVHSSASDIFKASHVELLTSIGSIAAIALEHVRYVEWLEGENRRLTEEINVQHDMIGDSPKMHDVYQFINKVAPVDMPVLISGESGTGKELIARAIHRNSRRSSGPFVAVNCGAIVSTLLESELFGHEKGAFTGAATQRKGMIESAHQGTLFLDEIGELPIAMQAALLRVLQDQEFQRVGSSRPIRVDVRVIAATNRNLEQMIKDGTFRQDLFFRLNVVPATMPPLRERGHDILLLAAYFIKKYQSVRNVSGMNLDAQRMLMDYAWPGNVRELENAIKHALTLGRSEYIQPEDLPKTLAVPAAIPDRVFRKGNYHQGVDYAKRFLVQRALRESNGDRTQAARLLDINRGHLHRLIRQLNL